MKQFTKHQNFICFVLVLSMLLLGMCYEDIRSFADSSFSCTQSSEEQLLPTTTATTLRAIESTRISSVVTSRESLGAQESAIQARQTIRSVRTRIGRTICILLFAVVFLPQLFSQFLQSTHYESIEEIYSNVVTVCYIHHQDGAKAEAHS